MVVISKHLFYEKITPDVTCKVFHDHVENCFAAPFNLLSFTLVPTFLFFLPIYSVKTILEYHKKGKLDKSYFINLILTQLRSSTYGYLLAALIQINLCSLSHLFKRHYYLSPGFFGGIFSGLSLLVESKENKILDTLIFFNQVVDSILQNLNYFKIFQLTKINQTALFATASALLMYFLQNRQTKKLPFTHLWFYVPEKESKDASNNYWKLFQNYFAIGYLISVIKGFIPNMLKLFRKPTKLLWIVFNLKNIKMGLFISSYVLLYKWLINKLNETKSIPADLKALLAGFSAGLTYLISPNLQILIICITTLLQVLLSKIKSNLNLPKDNPVLRQLLFMFCNGILLHNYIFCQETCPKFYLNMLNFCSGYRLKDIHRTLINMVQA